MERRGCEAENMRGVMGSDEEGIKLRARCEGEELSHFVRTSTRRPREPPLKLSRAATRGSGFNGCLQRRLGLLGTPEFCVI